MGPAAVPIILAVAATAGTGYQISQAERQRREAARAGERQEAEARKLEEQLRQRQTAEESAATAARVQASARKRQRNLSTGGTSPRDTLLTGPSGLVAGPAEGQKTLLGL